MKYTTNTRENLERLQQIQCFALDMDGTFYLGDTILPGSLNFIKKVVESGRDFLFVTNNSSHNSAYYVQRLARMGLTVDESKVYTSGLATAAYLNREYPQKRIFLLGNEYLHEELRQEGIIIDAETPEVVVVGFDTTLDFDKMTRVCDFIRAGLPYVATHPDYNCPIEGGGFIPDCGAIMAFIHASTNRWADIIIGKPHVDIVNGLVQRAGVPRQALAMVGDRLYTDIATGVNHGLLSILVWTGETQPEDLQTSPTQPDLAFERLSSMIECL